MTALDGRAVLAGATTAVAVALPVALLGEAVVQSANHTGLAFAFLLPVLGGFAAGGYIAATRAPGGPLANGAVAAVAAFALIQGVGVVRRLAAGEPLSLPSLAFAALLAYSSGLLGGVVAARRQTVDRADGQPGSGPGPP